jgi:TonB family protein
VIGTGLFLQDLHQETRSPDQYLRTGEVPLATEATTKQAQRQSPRWQPLGSKPVRVGLGPAGSGQLVDISFGGLRVQSLAPLRREAEVPVRLELPDHTEPLQVSGIVVWSKVNGAAGIRFINMNDGQKQVLQDWLADLEKATLNPTKREDEEFTKIVSQVRAAKLNNADALNLIVSRITQATSASGAAIALGNAENMVCMAAAGVAPEIGTTIPTESGFMGECVRRRKMVNCQNAQNDPRVGRDLNLGSIVYIPLLVNGELRGVLQAVSLSVYAFDSNAVDTLERLADAVVFLTFGIVPQRRVATVTPLTPATMTRLSVPASLRNPHPSSELPTRTPPVAIRAKQTPSYPAPVSAKPAIVASFPLPGVAPKPPAVEAPRVAPPPRTAEKAAPSLTSLADAVRIDELDSVARRIPTRFTETYDPPRSSSGAKWIAGAVIVIVLGAGSLFVSRNKLFSKATTAPPENVAVGNADTQPEQSIPEPATQVSAPVTSAVQAPVSFTPSVSSVSKTPPAKSAELVSKAAVHETIARENAAEKLHSNDVSKPIVLTGATPIRHNTEDPDAIPGAPHIEVAASADVPQLGIPATSAVPKLSAPVAKVRSGGSIIKKIPPAYPSIARSMRLEGMVELQVHVLKDGSVGNVQRLSGHTVLANAAIDAVKRWQFDPYKLDGEPIEMDTVVKLNFNAPR